MSVTMTVVATLFVLFLSIASFRACRPSPLGIFVNSVLTSIVTKWASSGSSPINKISCVPDI